MTAFAVVVFGLALIAHVALWARDRRRRRDAEAWLEERRKS